ncbi:MAG: helix-turn-helix domain-containing protein [Deltaproteobacteria bacterium]|nr:helix-turn-helix domain-containing protein [Deltaproteobacteria bacterium]
MEKDFDQLNYYEMLDIKPEATALEIRGAYNAAMQMYQPDSLVSYSFFSREERNKILALLDKAYLTLINEAQRARYDNEINPQGNSGAAEKGAAVKKAPVNIFDINRQGFNPLSRKNHSAELKEKISQNQRIREILSRQEISGADLKEIRNELGVTIETIQQETRIRLDYLNYIEEDKTEKLPAAVFLKGFIRAYLKSLCVETAEDISARYMSGLTRKN